MRLTIRPTLVLFVVLIGVIQEVGFAIPAPTSQPLSFRAVPKRHIFNHAEDVILLFSIQNNSSDPVFVSRLKGNDFVDIKLLGPDGKEVPWRGSGRIDSKNYSASDFVVLKTHEIVHASRTISPKDGTGFVFKEPGRYTVQAEYSLAPPEYFASLAGSAKIPAESFASPVSTFCIETCGPDSKVESGNTRD